MNVVICGSRKYQNQNFDKLVDSFDIIIRNNMLLPGNGYGKRDAHYQVLNCHVYQNYIKQSSLDTWMSEYQMEYGISTEHLIAFYEYLKLDRVQFKYSGDGNNTEMMRAFLKDKGIDHQIQKPLRCGFSFIAEALYANIKPFLIGFSLQEEDMLNKQFTNKESTGKFHDTNSEIKLITKLHSANLVDATFCAINDSVDLNIDSSLLAPTHISLNMLHEVHNAK